MIMGVSWEYDMYDGHGSSIEYGGNKILVGGILTPLKNMSSSVGMMTFPTEWKVIKVMFQTTNQIIYIWVGYCKYSYNMLQ